MSLILRQSDPPGRAIGGCTSRAVPPHVLCHTVPDDIVTMAIHRQFSAMLGRGWYGLVVMMNGSGVFAGELPLTPQPSAEVMHWMLDTTREINRQLHFSGHWICGWHRDQRPAFYFRDRHGVMQFEYGIDDSWTRIRRLPVDFFVARAEECQAAAAELASDLDLQHMWVAMRYAQKQANPSHMRGV